MNENGQRILELCSFHKLAVTNTYQHKDGHKVLWCYPRSKHAHWHQVDMILTKRGDLNNVQNTRSMHSADCDSEHILLRSNMHHSKTNSLPRINASRTSCSITTQTQNIAGERPRRCHHCKRKVAASANRPPPIGAGDPLEEEAS